MYFKTYKPHMPSLLSGVAMLGGIVLAGHGGLGVYEVAFQEKYNPTPAISQRSKEVSYRESTGGIFASKAAITLEEISAGDLRVIPNSYLSIRGNLDSAVASLECQTNITYCLQVPEIAQELSNITDTFKTLERDHMNIDPSIDAMVDGGLDYLPVSTLRGEILKPRYAILASRIRSLLKDERTYSEKERVWGRATAKGLMQKIREESGTFYFHLTSLTIGAAFFFGGYRYIQHLRKDGGSNKDDDEDDGPPDDGSGGSTEPSVFREVRALIGRE